MLGKDKNGFGLKGHFGNIHHHSQMPKVITHNDYIRTFPGKGMYSRGTWTPPVSKCVQRRTTYHNLFLSSHSCRLKSWMLTGGHSYILWFICIPYSLLWPASRWIGWSICSINYLVKTLFTSIRSIIVDTISMGWSNVLPGSTQSHPIWHDMAHMVPSCWMSLSQAWDIRLSPFQNLDQRTLECLESMYRSRPALIGWLSKVEIFAFGSPDSSSRLGLAFTSLSQPLWTGQFEGFGPGSKATDQMHLSGL